MMLSFIQGITEFLPVSSSGHLILFSKIFPFQDQGLAIDVAMHVGSILAVIIYFSEIIWSMIVGLAKSYFIPNFKNFGNRLFWLIVIATIPVVIIGLIITSLGTEILRSTEIIGWTILVFGILLYIADSSSMTIKTMKHLTIVDALLIGIAQCFALIPGTSRSGVTITMGRFLNLERREAAKFAMLLSIPTIIAAGLMIGYQLYQADDLSQIATAFDGITYSFICSITAIYFMMWWLKNATYLPFVIYRVVLGSALLLDTYGYINILK